MEWSEYSKILFDRCVHQEIPFHTTFELTPLCNFRCNMCYVRLDPEQARKQGKLLSTQQWLKIAEEAKRMGTITLEVTGGEAITRPDFCLLYESFIKMGYLIILRTNGYLIDQHVLKLLKQYKPRKVSVTLYGASDKMYERVCGITDGYSVVTRNVLAMKEAGLNVRLTMTVTNDNIEDFDILKQWAEENDLSITPFGALISPVRGAKRSIDHLQVQLPEEEYIIDEELKKRVSYKVTDRDTLMKPFWMCRGFGAKCCITWDGRMMICNTFTNIWTEPLKTGFEEAYHSLYSKLRELLRPEQCGSCEYIEFCAACPAQLQSATGTSDQTNERICKQARRKFQRFLTIQAGKKLKGDVPEILDQCEEEGLYED